MSTIRKSTTEIEYPESDGQPMAETDLHRKILTDLIERLFNRYAGRSDVYVTGNLLVYYEEGKPQKCLAPDCMVVFGVAPGDRRIYKTWDEGQFPTVVFEITSKSTEREDTLTKFRIYQDVWKIKELFMFDPTEDYMEPSLVGYRMSRGELKMLKPSSGRLSSTELGITIEREGTRLVLREAKTGKEVLLPAQAEAETARRKLRKAEKERADAEAELTKLRAELNALRNPPKE
jgi:Uma2 family endonuclease